LAVFRFKTMEKFYITTSIAYTNASPHGGYALELIQADVLARYNRSLGKDVFFLTGTDEHGTKIAKTAAEKGKDPKEFTELIFQEYRRLAAELNISNDDFIRTTDQIRHWPTAVKIWNLIFKKGDIYKKKYRGLYCVGHELFLKKSDLKDGLCPLHQTLPKKVEEENWFFKLSKYKNEIRKKIKTDELKIVPEIRKQEIFNLIDDAEDVSFSRPVESLAWGIPVPNDPSQTLYVWMDALTNYISALDYANDGEKFHKFWPADVHLIGKDILRFHALIWPAILLSAGLELPKAIYVHGFITVDGQKMSKTIGNVIDPFKLIEKYGVDPVRYFLLREIPSHEDGDFSYQKLEERHNGDLANNLGNLVSRVAKLIETKLNGELIFDDKFLDKEATVKIDEASKKVNEAIEEFKLHEALARIWEFLTFANVYIDEHKPWASDVQPEHILKTLTTSVKILDTAGRLLEPFLPETSQKILAAFGRSKESKDNVFRVIKIEPLFPRLK